EAPEILRSLEPPPADRYGLDFGALRRAVLQDEHAARFAPDALLAPAQVAYRIDTRTVTAAERLDAQLVFEPTRAGVVHGLCGWFEATLAPGIALGTAPPGIPSWDNAFFPLLDPLRVAAGARLHVRMRYLIPVAGDAVWSWRATLEGAPASAEQSSFVG